MPLRHTLLALALAVPAVAHAQAASSSSPITTNEIDGDLRFLSSDLLEGRAPATRGGELATAYIAAQLRAAGLEPGIDGSYLQPVPIDVVSVDAPSVKVTTSGKATGSLRFPDDVVVWAGSATPATAVHAEIVFAGYGTAASEYKWDDFKGVDVKGKILMVLVGDPPAPSSEPTLFGGKAMTYYGRWTYKFEEAERRGAVGALIVHRTAEASYPWHTVVGSWTTPQRSLPRDPSLPAPLGFRGWITDSAATALLARAGLDLPALRARAATRDFRPVSTGITLDVTFRSQVQRLQSNNVVGVVRGSDAALRGQSVALTAHWDHLGIGPAVRGDSIYNGAVDNGSGVATLLAVARAAVRAPHPKRSLVFAFVTAEEAGLLGSTWFAQHPPAADTPIIADLNVDVVTVSGKVRDLNVLGADKSTLGPMLARLIQPQGVRIAPDPHPEAGDFYRSDHFSFAKAGIPAVSIGAGTDYVGRPADWGLQQDADYNANRYHQPSDEYSPTFDLSGAVEIGDIMLRFATQLANQSVLPVWNADAEFKSARAAAPTTR